MWTFTASFQQCPTSSIPFIAISSPSYSSSSYSRLCSKPPTLICSAVQSQVETLTGTTHGRISDRTEIRFGLPSKGRMATDTLDLLKVHSSSPFFFFFFLGFFHLFDTLFSLQDCQLSVKQVNPRQYVANIPQVLANE